MPPSDDQAYQRMFNPHHDILCLVTSGYPFSYFATLLLSAVFFFYFDANKRIRDPCN